MRRAAFVLIVLSAATCCAAETIYVNAKGPNDPGTGAYKDPFRRIQDAIDSADNNDTVIVAQGVYTPTSPTGIEFKGKPITVRSTDPNNHNVVTATIVDSRQLGRCFYFHHGEDANSVLNGFTITNGHATYGGGLCCLNKSSPTITNCIITSNSGEKGGAIASVTSSPTISNCIISGNSADYGGGLSCVAAEPIIINCTIADNKASIEGNALACNSSQQQFPSNLLITNSILWNGGDEVWNNDNSTITITYSDVQDGWPGEGNIDVDPCFAKIGYGDPNGTPDDANDDFWLNGDYHLKSKAGRWLPSIYVKLDLAGDGFINLLDFAAFAHFWGKKGSCVPADLDNNGVVDFFDLKLLSDNYLANYGPGTWIPDEVTSPCIDAGNSSSNWTGEPWPNGKRINVGAYGGTIQASKNGNIADFNIDGIVNLVDFGYLACRWMTQQKCIEDLSGDSSVDFADLAILSNQWLTTWK